MNTKLARAGLLDTSTKSIDFVPVTVFTHAMVFGNEPETQLIADSDDDLLTAQFVHAPYQPLEFATDSPPLLGECDLSSIERVQVLYYQAPLIIKADAEVKSAYAACVGQSDVAFLVTAENQSMGRLRKVVKRDLYAFVALRICNRVGIILSRQRCHAFVAPDVSCRRQILTSQLVEATQCDCSFFGIHKEFVARQSIKPCDDIVGVHCVMYVLLSATGKLVENVILGARGRCIYERKRSFTPHHMVESHM